MRRAGAENCDAALGEHLQGGDEEMRAGASQEGRSALGAIGILLLLFIAAGRTALADGAFLSERAIKKLPAIPAQSAVIVFRDGQETLIVESALDGEGQSFGCIMPVHRSYRSSRQGAGWVQGISLP